jgi:hypothetical protein
MRSTERPEYVELAGAILRPQAAAIETAKASKRTAGNLSSKSSAVLDAALAYRVAVTTGETGAEHLDKLRTLLES